jgi:hypothetical protein
MWDPSSSFLQGGECATVTLFFFLAIQDMRGGAIRIFDEVNQSMDQRANLFATELLSTVASKTQSQFLFISPTSFLVGAYCPFYRPHRFFSGRSGLEECGFSFAAVYCAVARMVRETVGANISYRNR